ncbi:hypothetical protein RND71_008107 [Anisodus tanguticus]|uniref:Aconitase/3-isopropylmalate dehydratase large subunit alpha/beta/alpha domain-containing protein n=1 Tax=Anisodus tanguticus TaxID=243964 RepID=A0AAE1SNI8_9SOLA|nr:hypothetical protein RND71_008107 [Anisodus tanguticus]
MENGKWLGLLFELHNGKLKIGKCEDVKWQELGHRCILDVTGVPAVVDLACMRDAMNKLGSVSAKINPLVPVDLVIDHSVQVDVVRSENAVQANMEL